MEYQINPSKYDELFVGTSLRGHLDAPYQEVRDTLGEPLPAEEFDGKADAVWLIEFEDGTVATIYNYKDGTAYRGDQGTPTEELRDWHIGGKSQRAVELVHWLFGRDSQKDEGAR